MHCMECCRSKGKAVGCLGRSFGIRCNRVDRNMVGGKRLGLDEENFT